MRKKLKDKEIRVIRISKEAVLELLWENLIDNGELYFELHKSDDRIYHMLLDESGDLIYAVKRRTSQLDVDKIFQEAPVTTESLFDKNTNCKKIYYTYQSE